MRRFAITAPLLPLLIFLVLARPMPARAYDLPPCTRAEFRDLFDQIAEVQLELGASISNVDSLLEFARAKLETRGEQTTPLCADEFDYQRLAAEVTGDFIGRTALDLSDVPAAENPYRLQLSSEQARIEDLAASLLSADRTGAPAPAERSAPKCASDQLTALVNLLANFLDLLDSDADEPLAAIEARLRWRGEHISQAPMCSDGIELALLLSAAATDAAAAEAVALVAPGSDNPYQNSLADNKNRLSEWRIQLNERRARYDDGSAAETALPACSVTELAQAYGKLMPEYTDLFYRGQQLNSVADLQDFSRAYFNYRGTNLARLPACAEVFAAAWEVRQLLGDLLSSAARDMAMGSAADPFSDRLALGSARVARLIDGMASRLEGAGPAPDATHIETAVACSPVESLFLQVYILPEFYAFGEAAFAAQTPEDAVALTEQSLALRDLLWGELPRCAEAIELGLLMRRVAADFVAMLWLELAGLPPDDIAQAQAVVDDITRLSARAEAIGSGSASAVSSGKSYYISAGRGANIRSCGSTDCAIVTTLANGEKIDVADDSGAWYQLNLPNNQVGYIASFLVSQTPPG